MRGRVARSTAKMSTASFASALASLAVALLVLLAAISAPSADAQQVQQQQQQQQHQQHHQQRSGSSVSAQPSDAPPSTQPSSSALPTVSKYSIDKIRVLIADTYQALGDESEAKWAIRKLQRAIRDLEDGDKTDAADELLNAYKELECEDAKKVLKQGGEDVTGLCKRIAKLVGQVLKSQIEDDEDDEDDGAATMENHNHHHRQQQQLKDQQHAQRQADAATAATAVQRREEMERHRVEMNRQQQERQAERERVRAEAEQRRAEREAEAEMRRQQQQQQTEQQQHQQQQRASTDTSTSANAKANTKVQPNNTPGKDTKKKVVGPIELRAGNFDSSMRDGSAWLIEFYAPWCGHCSRFAATYEKVAQTLHAQSHADVMKDPHARTVKVAKVDGSADRALASRFNIRGYPTFFLVDGWNVYEFEGDRTLEDLVDFATEDYVDYDPIPFVNSPFGPMGQLRALFIWAGTAVASSFEWMVNERGFSKVAAAMVTMGAAIVVGLFLIVFIGLMCVAKPKMD